MTRIAKILTGAFLSLTAGLAVAGCAQNPGAGPAARERIQALEEKVTRAEADLRTAAAARDQVRAQLAAVQEQQARLQKVLAELRDAARERDELRKLVQARTGERDAVTAQLEGLRKSLKELLSQAEAAPRTADGAVPTAAQGGPGAPGT
jgi:chromosome segregation ATPase